MLVLIGMAVVSAAPSAIRQTRPPQGVVVMGVCAVGQSQRCPGLDEVMPFGGNESGGQCRARIDVRRRQVRLCALQRHCSAAGRDDGRPLGSDVGDDRVRWAPSTHADIRAGRESRHVNAVYQLTAEDITTGRQFDDVVALGAWAMEYHHAAGARSTWTPVKDKETYDIPLRTLISVDTPNLYAAGRAADGDQYAGGSLRVMGTALATGHAAGVAAALHSAAGSPVPARTVQQELQKQDARLPGR
jgi:hypothetical protein